MNARETPSSTSPKQSAGRGGRSNRLLRHDLRVVLRCVLPTALVFLVLFIVMTAVSTSAIPDISVFTIDFTHDQLKFRFWADAMTYPVVIGSLIFGAAMAFAAFRFLLIRSQTTTYLSLSLSRGALFMTRTILCAILILAVLAVSLGTSLILNLIALGPWAGEAMQFIYIVFGLFVCALVGYVVMLIALFLAGTQLEAVLFAMALLSGVSVICWGLNVCMDWLLVGNAAGEYLIDSQTQVAQPLLQTFSACNPVIFFISAAQAHQSFMIQHPVYAPVDPDWLLPSAWFIFSLALAFVGRLLFVNRRGEKAGMAGLCTPMTFVFSLVCGLAIFTLVFKMLASLSIFAGIAAGALLFIIVSLLLLRGPLRGETTAFGRMCLVLGVETGVLLISIVIVATGGLGWSTLVPSAAEVSSVQVSYTGSPMYLARDFTSASALSNSYYVSGVYNYSDTDSISTITAVQSELIQTGHAAYATDDVDFEKTVVPYDLEFSYKLKDGSTVIRYYDRATLQELASLLSLDDSTMLSTLRSITITGDTSKLSTDSVSTVTGSMTAQAFANGEIYLSDSLYENPLHLTCTTSARRGLLKALAADVEKQTSEDRYHPKGTCRAVIMFSNDGQNDAETFSYQMENSLIYVTDSFTQTLKWLKDKGLTSSLGKVSAGAITSLSFERYDPYAGMNDATGTARGQLFMGYRSTNDDDFITSSDFGTRFSTTSARKIAQLLPLMRATYYMDGGGYQVCAKLRDGGYTYLFIPASLAPEWLIRQAG